MNSKIHIRGANRWTLDSTPHRRPRWRLLPQDRVHRWPALLPRPDGGRARPHRVRDLRGRHREGHGPVRPHVVPRRRALHRGGQWLREPRGQPVPAVRVQGRALQALRPQRDLRRGRGRPVMPRTPALTAGAAPCERVRVTRDWRTRALGAVLAASCLLAWGCGSLPDETPTQPDPPTQPVAAAPTAEPNPNPTAARRSWGGPRRSPAPTPTSEATPEPSPTPGSTEGSGACGSPASTRPGRPQRQGPPTGRRCVDPRFDAPRRAGCHLLREDRVHGRARRVPRPTRGKPRAPGVRALRHRPRHRHRPSGADLDLRREVCTGRASGCENSADNQYQLRIFQGGVFKACGRNGVCGEVEADK